MYVEGWSSVVNSNECDFVCMEEREKINLADMLGIETKEKRKMA
jgi:hypothetical protein